MAGLLGNVFLGGSLALGAAIQPGPLQAFLVARVVATGWRRTLPACLTPLFSDGPAAILAIFLLGRIPPSVLHALRVAGGLLLLYLATGVFRQWRQPMPSSTRRASAPRTLLEAVLVNLLNPNPYLAWALVLGPAVVAAWSRHPGYALGFVAAFYATMVVSLAGFVFLVGTARFLDSGRQRVLLGASALLLAGLGVTLLVVGVREAWGG